LSAGLTWRVGADRFGARSATAMAKTDGALVPISRKDFVVLVSQAPTFAPQWQQFSQPLQKTLLCDEDHIDG
jgi:hypothetical protein